MVEDDLDQARIFSLFLKARNLDVICFSDPFEALKNFQMNLDKYAIVLTDFKMKNMNGVEFAREIRKLRGKDIFIILMTAYSLEDILKEREIVNIINKIIVKPFSLRNLDRVIRYNLDLIAWEI